VSTNHQFLLGGLMGWRGIEEIILGFRHGSGLTQPGWLAVLLLKFAVGSWLVESAIFFSELYT
jgi:hypothetical protein